MVLCYGSPSKLTHAHLILDTRLGKTIGKRQNSSPETGLCSQPLVSLPSQPKGDLASYLRILNNTQVRTVSRKPLFSLYFSSEAISPGDQDHLVGPDFGKGLGGDPKTPKPDQFYQAAFKEPRALGPAPFALAKSTTSGYAVRGRGQGQGWAPNLSSPVMRHLLLGSLPAPKST